MTGRRGVIALLALVGPALGAQESGGAPPGEQREEAGVETLTLRVTSVRAGGVVVVDRGLADGLREGDRVTLRPLDSRPRQGHVILASDRSAEVRLEGSAIAIAVGTQGFSRVPLSRFSAVDRAPAPPVEMPGDAPEHPPWENLDEAFTEDMPLLRSIDGVRPQDRAPIVSGLVFSAGNVRYTTDERSDGFFRLGTEVHYENPTGRGGQLDFVGEVNYRFTDVEGQVDESTTIGRVDRLSYSIGGTRFEPSRHEFGRFLHDGVPELGVIDGYEWNHRGAGGARFGASAGFLPEPTPHMSTGQDAAISAFYQWAYDEREELTATGAYQKTWHNGAADRDLFVLKMDYWQYETWDFHGAAWLDWYGSSDTAKGTGLDVTRVVASTSRRYENGNGLTFTYRHEELPEVQRLEYAPVPPDIIADEHADRLGADGWTWVRPDRRLFARTGAWVDQEDYGGDLEVGVEQLEWFLDDSRTELSVFGSRGKYSSLLGFRAIFGVQRDLVGWSASYEYFQSDQLGFSDDNDDLNHHRLLGNLDLTRQSGWNLSLRGGLERWSDELAAVAGFYLQRSF